MADYVDIIAQAHAAGWIVMLPDEEGCCRVINDPASYELGPWQDVGGKRLPVGTVYRWRGSSEHATAPGLWLELGGSFDEDDNAPFHPGTEAAIARIGFRPGAVAAIATIKPD